VTDRRPLPTLLSQLLVAFTIEFDNESERRITALDSRRRFLVSQAMWANFMQYVGKEAIPLREVEPLARITNLGGLERWGYVAVEPDPADLRPRPPRRDLMVRATPAGLRAQQVWRPLAGEIERRWRERFGHDEIGRLRQSLSALVSQSDGELPRYLPVVNFGNGMLTSVPRPPAGLPAAGGGAPADLSVLLSRGLLVAAIEFERESDLSLAISANALRVLPAEGAAIRDLPRLTGVSKEAISSSVGFLSRKGYAVVEPDPAASRGQRVRLTPKGRRAQDTYHRLLGVIEQGWRARLGPDGAGGLRESAQNLFDQADDGAPRLSQGLRPPPDGWRARPPYLAQTTAVIRDPGAALPHYPMVLHRGGWPDGS